MRRLYPSASLDAVPSNITGVPIVVVIGLPALAIGAWFVAMGWSTENTCVESLRVTVYSPGSSWGQMFAPPWMAVPLVAFTPPKLVVPSPSTSNLKQSATVLMEKASRYLGRGAPWPLALVQPLKVPRRYIDGNVVAGLPTPTLETPLFKYVATYPITRNQRSNVPGTLIGSERNTQPSFSCPLSRTRLVHQDPRL